jgi:hypothetical protein
LTLATLRSPFLPQAYGAYPAVWLLTLLAAAPYAAPRRVLAIVLVGWLALCVYWPMDWAIDPRLLAVVNTLPQAVTVGLVVFVLRKGLEAPGRSVPVPALRTA